MKLAFTTIAIFIIRHRPLQATNLEFRFRFFVFMLIYVLGFAIRSSDFPLIFAEWLASIGGHPTRVRVQAVFAVAALILVLAGAIRTWATAYLRGEVVHDMAMHSDRLVADGPYRYVRNPLYLGTSLMAAGIGFLAPAPNWIFMVLATVVFNLRLILREEAGLAANQSQSFLAFKAAVPRLLPALTPRLPGSGRRPQWRQAWGAESFVWAFAIAMLVFAITLNTQALKAIMLGSVLIYGILHIVNSYRQKKARLA